MSNLCKKRFGFICIPNKIIGKLHLQNLTFGKNQKDLLCSREPKAQVSFSDNNVFVVRRRRCRRCRKLITFSSSPESQGQFQPNLAQRIFR